MLVTTKVARALADQADTLRSAAHEAAALLERYRLALEELEGFAAPALEARLAGEPWPGAVPSVELEQRGLVLPFGTRWDSAQQARDWALQRLRGVATAGIDGSQVAASKELGVPLSLVQVAWFENYHTPDRPYVKDVRDEIVLVDTAAREIEEYAGAESLVNQRRFVLEMEVAAERVRSLAGEPLTVVFVDGTLVPSFVGRLSAPVRQTYLQALFRLLDASRLHEVPVVGYVDLSYASDLLTMLRTLFDLPKGAVFDARVLAPLMETFDRTAAFRAARADVLPHYRTDDRDYTADLGFVYLKTGVDRLPARLDVPVWVLDAGLLDGVVDVVRAEVVVGSGYPYALETADAAAVLTAEDRMAFYRLFHEFARSSGLAVYLPAKSTSKARRR